ncbi:MAG: hypothetical protein ACOCRK_02775 [bacterium]
MEKKTSEKPKYNPPQILKNGLNSTTVKRFYKFQRGDNTLLGETVDGKLIDVDSTTDPATIKRFFSGLDIIDTMIQQWLDGKEKMDVDDYRAACYLLQKIHQKFKNPKKREIAEEYGININLFKAKIK